MHSLLSHWDTWFKSYVDPGCHLHTGGILSHFYSKYQPSSTVYSMNRIGPRTKPCGIPDINSMGADLQPSEPHVSYKLQNWVLLVRYEQNHSSDILDTAKMLLEECKVVISVKMLLKRSRIKQVTSWQSNALMISVLTLRSAIPVLCNAL